MTEYDAIGITAIAGGTPQLAVRRCKDCDKPFIKGEERHFLNNFNMDAICLTCEEKRRINNRGKEKEQRRLCE